ncbi:DUF5057 domain-containing protein [Bacillus testis]|uniref:DUF5057 domain-containing protein n=1 Tax=Bacillus testis TaxID=1622072 RepID=UPI00067ED751|nr:DUF5057 domain-containing protein [Bacillus testis]
MGNKKIKWVSLLTIWFLLLSLLPDRSFLHTQKAKAEGIPKYQILEIVDKTGKSSQLTSIINKDATLQRNVEISTMPMKKFVAQRDGLDGEYDGIAIMEGEYTSAGVSGKAHNTTAVMNDITDLKAKEIIDDYIKKGQMFIIHKGSIDKGAKMKANFAAYKVKENNPKNMLVYSDEDSLKRFMKNFYSDNAERPRMDIPESSMPSLEKGSTYKAGDTLTIPIHILKPSNAKDRDMTAKLYIDSDFNDRYDDSEVVVEQKVAGQALGLSYKFPKGYSGIRNWKVELVDNTTRLKDYKSGRVYFKDKLVTVKVLQVHSNNGSSLRADANMNQSFLKRNGEYDIQITPVSMEDFNNRYAKIINGNYDMVIFGFSDSYNVNARLTQSSADYLKTFIASKQSIMFTHDTVFLNNDQLNKSPTEKKNDENNNVWVRNFKEDTGQVDPRTNLGYGAPNTSTNTTRVNEGLVTNYPFKLNENLKVNNTHNQYYTLDLEDPEVIPWYNIVGSNRDVNDSYNHYYMYSKGNITYSGTGHTPKNFPQSEQELFVNTMYRAFLGSNHAPEITVLTPTEDSEIPSNQPIGLSYIIDDYDLKDTKLKTNVYFNGKEVYSNNDVTSGATISQSLEHNLPQGGALEIKIVATDSSGAETIKIVNVKVKKLDVSLEVKRTTDAKNPTEAGKPVMINYMITPKDITGAAVSNVKGDTLIISRAVFEEQLPANLNVNLAQSSDGMAIHGDSKSGITVTNSIGTITYKRSGNRFVASPITFSLAVTPEKKGSFVLDHSEIRYQDFNAIEGRLTRSPFNALTIVADYALKGIELPNQYVISRDSTKNFSLDLKCLPADAGIKEIKWKEMSAGTVLQLAPATGTGRALKAGETVIEVQVTDHFGNIFTKKATVRVRIPINKISAEDLTIHVGEEKELKVSTDPTDGKPTLEYTLVHEEIASFDKGTFTLTGKKQGETLLTLFGYNSEGTIIEKTVKITVVPVLISNIIISPNEIKIKKGDSYSDFNITIQPANATDKNLIWESTNNTIVQVTKPGVIKGVGTGTAEVMVYSPDRTIKETIKVMVGSKLEGIKVPESITIEKGEKIKMPIELVPADASDIISVKVKEDNGFFISVLDNGVLEGLKLGETFVITTVISEEKTFTARTRVIVVGKGEKDDNPGGGNGKETDLY